VHRSLLSVCLLLRSKNLLFNDLVCAPSGVLSTRKFAECVAVVAEQKFVVQ
jgi:hypothetical protein